MSVVGDSVPGPARLSLCGLTETAFFSSTCVSLAAIESPGLSPQATGEPSLVRWRGHDQRLDRASTGQALNFNGSREVRLQRPGAGDFSVKPDSGIISSSRAITRIRTSGDSQPSKFRNIVPDAESRG
jgi:hypothetical protein